MKRLAWGLLLVLAIAAAAVVFRGQAVRVKFEKASIATVREYITEDAKTRLATVYTIDMPVSGTVERIALEIGDTVQKGDVIIRVDPYPFEQGIKELQSLIRQARAQVSGVDISKPKPEDLESAAIGANERGDALEIAKKVRTVTQFNLIEAEKDFQRAKALIADGAISQSFYDGAELRYKGLIEDCKRVELQEKAASKALELADLNHRRLLGSVDDNEYMRQAYLAQIEGLQAQLALLEMDLAKTTVLAPVSGPILQKHVSDRRVLPAGTPLLAIGDMQSIEIECDVLSEEVGRIRDGSPVEISGKALGGTTLPGRIKRIYPAGFMKISSLGVEQQRIRALIAFDNGQAQLRPGTSLDLRIITAESPGALAIPDRAAIRRDGQWHVFIVEGGRATLVPIEIGLRNDDWAEVLEGLSPDATIIAEPKNELEDGARVAPLE